jgi:hypothetical protein
VWFSEHFLGPIILGPDLASDFVKPSGNPPVFFARSHCLKRIEGAGSQYRTPMVTVVGKAQHFVVTTWKATAEIINNTALRKKSIRAP